MAVRNDCFVLYIEKSIVISYRIQSCMKDHTVGLKNKKKNEVKHGRNEMFFTYQSF